MFREIEREVIAGLVVKRGLVIYCIDKSSVHPRFDHPMDVRALHYDRHATWIEDTPDTKRRKIDLKFEHDETNDNYCFPETLKNCKDNT